MSENNASLQQMDKLDLPVPRIKSRHKIKWPEPRPRGQLLEPEFFKIEVKPQDLSENFEVQVRIAGHLPKSVTLDGSNHHLRPGTLLGLPTMKLWLLKSVVEEKQRCAHLPTNSKCDAEGATCYLLEYTKGSERILAGAVPMIWKESLVMGIQTAKMRQYGYQVRFIGSEGKDRSMDDDGCIEEREKRETDAGDDCN
ncbi:hypothetical protein BDV95DRAFT_317592 [Massariosphaeria phaeospora]|uniref:Uncharacterized protein n=1 Tax=Massariosphaeria phaeospora TaxID=100035 RepID=A0A7C8M8U2_9PLEO|nr:hypothetical protein BDV95DRAFT_317592 [Massariosphaeria phaeospora]